MIAHSRSELLALLRERLEQAELPRDEAERCSSGCSALDRHALSGVTCPPGHEGTLTLIEKFNQEMHDAEEEKGWFDTVVHTITTAAAVVTAVSAPPRAAASAG